MQHTNAHANRITLRPLSRPPAVSFPLPNAAPAADATAPLGQWLELWMDDDIEPNRAFGRERGRGEIHKLFPVSS